MGMMMAETTVIRKVKTFAKEIWGMDFNLPVEFSGRMTSTFGYFSYNEIYRLPIKLQFSKRLINGDYEEHTIDSVILHELAHWYLFVQNKPHKDGHPIFEAELKRIGASSTHTIKYAGQRYQVICSKCGKIVADFPTYQKAMNLVSNGRKISRCCRAKLVYGGSKYNNDTYKGREARDQKAAEAIQKMASEIAASSPVPTIPQAKVVTKITINDVIGTTSKIKNAQMIEALTKAVEEDSKEKVELLKQHYPEIFTRCIRYLKKHNQDKLQKLM